MFVPDQNQLYAMYMFRCGEYGVGKPNKEMLALLAEDDLAWNKRIGYEARERGISIDDLRDIEADTEEQQKEREAIVPLSMRRVLRLDALPKAPANSRSGGRLHVGARGALAIVDVARELPFLEVLDFSNLTSLFIVDHYQSGGITGNDVIMAICHMAVKHPSLRVIDVSGQPLGTLSAHHFLDLLQQNRRIQEVHFDHDAVDYRLVACITKEMQHNAEIPRGPPLLPRAPSAEMQLLPILDRKTVREQQLLRRLMESEIGLGSLMSPAEISDAVLHARIMSTTEVVTRSKGLRGDGIHLFLLKSGVLRASANPGGFDLKRGDYFGETYPEKLFGQDMLDEVVRGVVYCIPLEHCRALYEAWRKRVVAHFPKLHYSPLLQALGVWARLRLCCCSTPRVFKGGETVIAQGDSFKGLFLVTSGTFTVVNRSLKAQGIHVFTVGDVFGEESLLTRRECSSVTIAAEEGTEVGCCLVVEGCAARVLLSHLRPVLKTLSSAYSLHEELQSVK